MWELGQETFLIALDLKKAFDRVWHQGLVEKLRAYGFAGKILKWINDFLRDRFQKVVVEGEGSRERPVTSGVPQGSVIGPLLFLLYINDLADGFGNMYKYADDTTLLYHSEGRGSKATQAREKTVKRIISDLGNIEGWMKKWKMEVSAEKSQALLLTRSQVQTPIPEVCYGGRNIPYAKSIKLLGVHISSNLVWDTHLQQMLIAANRARYILGKLRGIVNEADMLRYYKATVRPLLEYCSPLFAGACVSSLARLERFEQKCYTLIAKDPTRSADIAAKQDTLQMRRQVGSLTYLGKIIAGNAPLRVRAVVPHFEKPKQTLRKSKRLVENAETKLAFDSSRPNYAQRSGLNYAAKLFNEMPQSARKILKNHIERKEITSYKRVVVDMIRDKAATGLAKRNGFAHDPHSGKGPPSCCVNPSRTTLK
jgi:hypothetical protein